MEQAAPVPAVPAQAQPQQPPQPPQFPTDYSQLSTVYTNFCRVSVTPEELVLQLLGSYSEELARADRHRTSSGSSV